MTSVSFSASIIDGESMASCSSTSAGAARRSHERGRRRTESLLDRVLRLDPVGSFEPLLRTGSGGTEQPVVLVEPLEQDGGDVARGASAWRRGQASAGRGHRRDSLLGGL
jgi:hypothetical protein